MSDKNRWEMIKELRKIYAFREFVMTQAVLSVAATGGDPVAAAVRIEEWMLREPANSEPDV